ncbi:MAG: hypothetical protein V3T58_05605 [Candidatus Hydrothermarchaeales archaeon]
MEREKIGLAMIILGVFVWPVGLLILKLKPMPYVLASHLLLVIPGVYLRGSKIFKRIRG